MVKHNITKLECITQFKFLSKDTISIYPVITIRMPERIIRGHQFPGT